MAEDIEEPAFEMVAVIDAVEIRRYAASIQAVTRLDNNGQTSRGFRRLANYIFGGNETAESIAMTAPVQETLGTSAPEMAFTMPSAFSYSELPKPLDDRVELRPLKERYTAVVSFGGWATAGKVKKAQQTLEAALGDRGIETLGPSTLNQYNPPWTLPFMRRNEVAVDIDWSADQSFALKE